MSVEQILPLSLLVVDNIWSEEEAELLSGIDDNCVVVVTTRRRSITRVLNADPFEVENMIPPEAISLLRNKINRSKTSIKEGEYQNELIKLAKRADYWPLLLDIASSLTVSFIDDAKGSVATALNEAYELLEDKASLEESLTGLLEKSLNFLGNRINHRFDIDCRSFYLRLSIFSRSIRIPLDILTYVLDISYARLKITLLEMSKLSLIRFYVGENYIQLHDELQIWARARGEISDEIVKTWNREFLSQARNSHRSWGELILKHQYFSDHISYHLIESGNLEWAEEIFTDVSSLIAILKMNGSAVLRNNLERISEAFPSTSERLKPLTGMVERDRSFLNRCRHHAVETLEAIIYSRIAGQEGFHALDQAWRDHVTKPCLIPILPINVEQSELIDRRNLGDIIRLCRISADGTIVVAVTDSKLVVWDWTKGEDPKDLFELRSGVKPVVCHMSDDGGTIVLLTTDGFIKIWERQDGEQLWHNMDTSWIVPRAKPTWCALSGNGKVLALIGSGGTVRVYERTGSSWNNEPFKRSSIWVTQNQLLQCALNQNGANLIVTSNEKAVRAWDWQDGKWSSAFVFRDIPKSAMEISVVPRSGNKALYRINRHPHNKSMIMIVHSDKKWTKKSIHYWSREEVVNLDSQEKLIIKHLDNPRVLVLRSIVRNEPDREFHGHSKQITCCDLSGDANYIVSGSEDCTVCVWDIDQRKVRDRIDNICLSASRKYLAVSTNRGVQLWDTTRQKLLEKIHVHGKILEVADSGECIITSDDQGRLNYWSRSDGIRGFEEVSRQNLQIKGVIDAGYSDINPNGSLVAVLEADDTLMIYKKPNRSSPITELRFDDSLRQCHWISSEHLVIQGLRGLYWLQFSKGS